MTKSNKELLQMWEELELEYDIKATKEYFKECVESVNDPFNLDALRKVVEVLEGNTDLTPCEIHLLEQTKSNINYILDLRKRKI